jgi:hypothetical protein
MVTHGGKGKGDMGHCPEVSNKVSNPKNINMMAGTRHAGTPSGNPGGRKPGGEPGMPGGANGFGGPAKAGEPAVGMKMFHSK